LFNLVGDKKDMFNTLLTFVFLLGSGYMQQYTTILNSYLLIAFTDKSEAQKGEEM